MVCYAMLCYDMVWHVLCYATLCYAMVGCDADPCTYYHACTPCDFQVNFWCFSGDFQLRDAMLCYAMPCYAMLYHAMLCCAMLRDAVPARTTMGDFQVNFCCFSGVFMVIFNYAMLCHATR